jgi:lysophospholipase L1-like esterase
MIRSWSLLLAALLVVSGCSDQPKISRLAPDAVVLAFGDSLTYGKGAPREASYPAVLARKLERQVINAGISGEVSAAGLQRLPELLETHQPALVILCHGGNDFLRRLEKAALKENLRRMILLAREAGADVVLVGVPKFGLLPSPAPLYEELATELELPYEEKILRDILTERSLKSDQIHPNAEGYRLMAKAIAIVIAEAQAG